MAKLCLVPTPIGNLEDITLRSIRILKEADIIFAEDTRVTKKLLNHLEISAHVLPFHSHNEHKALSSTIDKIKSCGLAVLVSDAGTPGISDPGFLLTRACVENGIEVDCLPGATAFVPALVNSGLPNDKFIFEGFLPDKKGRQTRYLALVEETRTMILYVSPHKLLKTLAEFIQYFGTDRQVSVSREISKLHEETIRGTAEEVLKHFEAKPPKGEIVVVVGGKSLK